MNTCEECQKMLLEKRKVEMEVRRLIESMNTELSFQEFNEIKERVLTLLDSVIG